MREWCLSVLLDASKKDFVKNILVPGPPVGVPAILKAVWAR